MGFSDEDLRAVKDRFELLLPCILEGVHLQKASSRHGLPAGHQLRPDVLVDLGLQERRELL